METCLQKLWSVSHVFVRAWHQIFICLHKIFPLSLSLPVFLYNSNSFSLLIYTSLYLFFSFSFSVSLSIYLSLSLSLSLNMSPPVSLYILIFVSTSITLSLSIPLSQCHFSLSLSLSLSHTHTHTLIWNAMQPNQLANKRELILSYTKLTTKISYSWNDLFACTLCKRVSQKEKYLLSSINVSYLNY